jgi:glutathione S-transferase
MILVGMFDSPFVRRVAVSMNLLQMPFEHRNWSVGKDFELIRQFNPLGRVPALVQPDGDPDRVHRDIGFLGRASRRRACAAATIG